MSRGDYILELEYLTPGGSTEKEYFQVNSYQDGFKTMNSWLWKNARAYECMLISATIREI